MATSPAASTSPILPDRRRRGVSFALIVSVPLAVSAALLALGYTGAFDTELLLFDAGVVVTRGLPIARVLHDIAATVTIGLLLTAAFFLPHAGSLGRASTEARERAVRWASLASTIWLLAGVAVLVFTAANTVGTPVTTPTFPEQLWFYVTELELGQIFIASLSCVALVHLITLVTRRPGWLVVAVLIAIAALLPLSLAGHAAGADEHANAVNSLALHIVAVTLWAGGLVAVVLLSPWLKEVMVGVVTRYSALAASAFAAVALTGFANALLRLPTIEDLVTPYGQLLIVKTLALLALGAAGLWHRRQLIPRLAESARSRVSFVRLAVGEIVVMAATIGISVALSGTQTPEPESLVPNEARRSLLGFAYPPELTPMRFLSEWHLDWVGLAIGALAAAWYFITVSRLRASGRNWPLHRALSFLAGCFVLIFATSGGLGVYAQVHFSVQILQQLTLMIVFPFLMVAGRPFLLDRELHPEARDAEAGFRSWVHIFAKSRVMSVATTPLVAFAFFATSLVAFYATGWFEWSMFFHQGRVAICVASVGSGLLLALSIRNAAGNGDVGRRAASMLVLGLAVFLGICASFLFAYGGVLAPSWWHAMSDLDAAALLRDQRRGAAIIGVIGAALVLAYSTFEVARYVRRNPVPS